MDFSHIIISWFRENGRDLPWRNTSDPYAIWLSEIILQQTRISQGWEYWERFMRQYPTVAHLAEASEDDVLKLWQGLGYYSRARNLHAAAKQIVALGRFPDTLEGIKGLKGVGDYTAAAIASFAFGISSAVVDGNVYRVLARYFGISIPINTTQGKKEFAALAQSLLPEPAAVASYNQGLMDFGAIQCTPLSPKCLLCPLADTCEALRSGSVKDLPVKQKTLKVRTRYLTYVYIRRHSSLYADSVKTEVAIRRREAGDIWQGLWEPFNASLHEDHGTASVGEICDMLRLDASDKLILLAHGVKHVLTHQVLLADFYLLDITRDVPLSGDYHWIAEEALGDYGVPRLIELLIAKVNQAENV